MVLQLLVSKYHQPPLIGRPDALPLAQHFYSFPFSFVFVFFLILISFFSFHLACWCDPNSVYGIVPLSLSRLSWDYFGTTFYLLALRYGFGYRRTIQIRMSKEAVQKMQRVVTGLAVFLYSAFPVLEVVNVLAKPEGAKCTSRAFFFCDAARVYIVHHIM